MTNVLSPQFFGRGILHGWGWKMGKTRAGQERPRLDMNIGQRLGLPKQRPPADVGKGSGKYAV